MHELAVGDSNQKLSSKFISPLLVSVAILEDLLRVLEVALFYVLLCFIKNLHHDSFVVLGLLYEYGSLDQVIEFLLVHSCHSVNDVAPEYEEQSRDGSHVKTLRQLWKVVNVDFDQLEFAFILIGDLLKNRSELLAWLAPVSIQVKDNGHLLLIHDFWLPLVIGCDLIDEGLLLCLLHEVPG